MTKFVNSFDMLVARMKDVLPLIASPNQLAFLGNRQITDNIVLAHKFMHLLKYKKRKKNYDYET